MKIKNYDIYILFISAAISIIVSISDLLGILDSLPWLKDRISVIILLSNGVILGSIASLITNRITEIRHEISELKEISETQLFERVSDLRFHLDPTLSLIIRPHVTSIIEKLITVLKDKKIYLEDLELFRSIYKSTLREFPRSEFYCTSIPCKVFFWKNQTIESSIANFVKNGGSMKRIFFLSNTTDLQDDDIQKILRIQHQIGVEVYVSLIHNIPSHLQRFFLVDKDARICWEPRRGPDNSIKGIEISSSTENANNYLKLFDQLISLDGTKPYELSCYGLDPHNLYCKMGDLKMSDVKQSNFKNFELYGWQMSGNSYHDFWEKLTSQTADVVLELVTREKDDRLCDIATGPGYMVASAMNRGMSQVVGVDFSDVMLKKAREICRNTSAEFQEHDAENLEFKDESFDCATMNFGILHLANPQKAISEAFRILKWGGRFAFTAWSTPDEAQAFSLVYRAIEVYGNPEVPLPQGPPFFQYSDPNTCLEALNTAGFKNPKVRKLNIEWEICSGEDLFNAFYLGTARTGGLLRAQTKEALVAIRESIIVTSRPYEKQGSLVIPMPVVIASGDK